jgi:cephalosporin hydroxylase
MREKAHNRLAGKDYVIIEKFSEDAIHDVPDNSLDFVYLDADHSYDFVMQDIILWGRKLKKGGAMSGHDYYDDSASSKRRTKVVQAIDDYVKTHGIKFFITGEDHKKLGWDYYPSWFWIKEDDIWPNVIKI